MGHRLCVGDLYGRTGGIAPRLTFIALHARQLRIFLSMHIAGSIEPADSRLPLLRSILRHDGMLWVTGLDIEIGEEEPGKLSQNPTSTKAHKRP